MRLVTLTDRAPVTGAGWRDLNDPFPFGCNEILQNVLNPSISGRLASSRRRPKNSLLLHFLRLVSEAGDRCVGRHGCPRRQPLVLALCADELRALVYLAMRQRVDNACLWHRLNVVSSAACCLVLCLHEERSYLKITGQIILLLKQMNCGVINLQ